MAASASFQSDEQDFRERKFEQIIGHSSALEAVLEQVLSREPSPELAAQVAEGYRRLLAAHDFPSHE